MTVLAAHCWRNNAELIEACAKLGYLKSSDLVLDPTYGKGKWWTKWRPDELVASDLKDGVDFRYLPYVDGHFDAAVFDPPYVAKGGRETSGTKEFDERFGLKDCPKTPQQLLAMNVAGLKEVTRVTKSYGFILVKCMDYVSSGKLVSATFDMQWAGHEMGLFLWDRLEHVGKPRMQPKRTRKDGKPVVQQHARRNYSTLLVFRKKR